jgi:tetratricopeptide (TPR) repeat protein
VAGTDGTSAAATIRELLVAYYTQRDPQLLTAALAGVQKLLTAPGFAELDGSARAFVWTLGAAASTLQARTIQAQPEDLNRAIEWTDQAIDSWPPDDPNLPPTQANLATALTDRFQRDADPADLERALSLFDAAIPRLRDDGKRVDIALHSQGVCYHERATAAGGRGIVDLERAIELFGDALGCPDPDPEERAGYLNSLGLSLRAKGQARADRVLLTQSAAAYREAREQASPGSENYVAATLNLATVLQDCAEADNDLDPLREAVQLYPAVLPLVDERRHLQVTTNLATALVNVYRYSRDRSVLEDAARDLRRSAEGLPEGTSRQIVLANLGAALHEMFDHTGRIALLDEAIAVQDELLAPPGPRTPERTLNLGVSLLARFRRRRASADLDQGIALFKETARITTSRIERASALNSQANALSMQFDDTGARTDIDRCVELREQAVATAPTGSLDVALYRGNLGVDLLKRFALTADDCDLQRAVDEQRQAVRDAPTTSTDQPRLLAGLADSLARRASQTASPDDAAAARSTYRQVIELGRESLPEQALGAAMRWGAWEAQRRCWTDAGNAYQLALASMGQLVGRQQRRADKESWLAEAQGLPAAAGFALVQSGHPDRAVIALEHGRAMLLAEALQRQPLIRHGIA